ncbi:hypothetical protein EVAR_23839_1 [Eumeta japonica]|uniref:Uncharacterized protein n=1 Tax=Eumeta variegata TaxID=151549 RepID=A0A4C1V5A1_EUMVA|nr:hypothetical protein EVAR_23839_1 [Eumeta japonica]
MCDKSPSTASAELNRCPKTKHLELARRRRKNYLRRRRKKRVDELLQSGWSPPPIDIRNPRGTTSALLASWEIIGYLMERRYDNVVEGGASTSAPRHDPSRGARAKSPPTHAHVSGVFD